MSEQTTIYESLADGCFRDPSTLYKNADGEWSFLEFTPILNPKDRMTHQNALKAVADCALAGGGWKLPTVKQEISLRNYARYQPASDVPDSPDSGYVITDERTAWDTSSGCDWAVGLHYGNVYSIYPDGYGFVRGCRNYQLWRETPEGRMPVPSDAWLACARAKAAEIERLRSFFIYDQDGAMGGLDVRTLGSHVAENGALRATVAEQAKRLEAAELGREEFNRAINFAIDCGSMEGLDFLRAWREGDEAEGWPEFAAMQPTQQGKVQS